MRTIYDFGGGVLLVEYEVWGETRTELLVGGMSISDCANGEEKLSIPALKAALVAIASDLVKLKAGGLQ